LSFEKRNFIHPKNRRCLCEEVFTLPIKLSSLSDPERSEGELKDLRFRGISDSSIRCLPWRDKERALLVSTISMIELPDQGPVDFGITQHCPYGREHLFWITRLPVAFPIELRYSPVGKPND
jgi:hypothetical protein